MNKELLVELYSKNKSSVSEISKKLSTSESKVNYWLKKYNIEKRSISDAQYIKRNPKGDPFKKIHIKTLNNAYLFGMGIGLYWGEGTKRNKTSVRIGNTDPRLIKKFIEFLETIYTIDKNKLKFGLQIFNDSNSQEALRFWINTLGVNRKQFQKIIVSSIRGKGTYLRKSKYGVLTIYFNNVKLRNILCQEIEKL